jgi:hypothetical protein
LVIATAKESVRLEKRPSARRRAIGKKQDKLGRWRTAKVPNYATDAAHAYDIDERMKQFRALGANT